MSRLARNRIDRACLHCGKSPISGYKFCSDLCRDTARRLNRNLEPPAPTKYRCNHCDKSFCSNAVGRIAFCSKECEYKARQETPWSDLYQNVCLACRKTWCANKPRKYCSIACRHIDEADIVRARADQRCCAVCNQLFERQPVKKRGRRPVCCSAACDHERQRIVQRKQEAKRRASQKAVRVESVDPIKVLERDNWHCRVCDRPTPREKRGTTDDDAPEVDHIIPLCVGGPHVYWNVRCTCRTCNQRKRGTPPVWFDDTQRIPPKGASGTWLTR
jgi:hypothetical protein